MPSRITTLSSGVLLLAALAFAAGGLSSCTGEPSQDQGKNGGEEASKKGAGERGASEKGPGEKGASEAPAAGGKLALIYYDIPG